MNFLYIIPIKHVPINAYKCTLTLMKLLIMWYLHWFLEYAWNMYEISIYAEQYAIYIYIYMITKRIKKLLSIKRRKQFSKYYYITYIIYYLLILIILIPYFIFKYKYCLDFNFHRLKYTKISSRIISVNRSKEFARMNRITNNRNFLTRLLWLSSLLIPVLARTLVSASTVLPRGKSNVKSINKSR